MTRFEIALVILAGGYVAGGVYDRFRESLAERRQAHERALNGPDPMCGCRHRLAYHDPNDGRCYAIVKDKQPLATGRAMALPHHGSAHAAATAPAGQAVPYRHNGKRLAA